MWADFLKAKYCRLAHHIDKKWRTRQSHGWKKFVPAKGKVEEVRIFLSRNKVDLFGYIGIRVKKNISKRTIQKIAKEWNVCFNYPSAQNGRIWVLWKGHPNVQVLNIKEQFIHCLVEDNQFYTCPTMVYANNELQQRHILWRELIKQKPQVQTPWLLCEDINNVLTSEDKICLPVTQQEIQGFQWLLDTL